MWSPPDETAFAGFRRALREGGLCDGLFETISQQIDEKDLFVKRGTSIDAGHRCGRQTPSQNPRGGLHRSNPMAFAKKNDVNCFAYEMRVGADGGSTLIRKAEGGAAPKARTSTYLGSSAQ
jgi:IS5 family transposase